MTGRLVISLDFELMWGVRDHRSTSEYGDAVMGGRAAIPKILREFEKSDIRATWATVGFLFARNRDEILEYAPEIRPSYRSPEASPYPFIENGLGEDEAEDPLHFGHSLVQLISATEGQEIATHSFSHFCCQEEGHSREAFDADLKSACALAQANGNEIRSIVFARNQMTDESVAVAADHGIKVFRGNPDTFAYRPRSSDGNSPLVRLARLADSVVPISGRLDVREVGEISGVRNVTASRFLRPYNRSLPWVSKLHVRRILQEMELAARDHRIYHLWWHPHNFGRDQSENLRQLSDIIDHFKILRDRFGMQSVQMGDFA